MGAIEDPETGFEQIVFNPNASSFVQGFWVFDLGALTPLTVRPSSCGFVAHSCCPPPLKFSFLPHISQQAIYPLLLVVVIALNKSILFEDDRAGFERISDVQRAGEPPRSPTQWRRKFLLASPQPALIDQRASGAGVEAIALSHKRSHSGLWDEGDAVSLGRGEVL